MKEGAEHAGLLRTAVSLVIDGKKLVAPLFAVEGWPPLPTSERHLNNYCIYKTFG